MLKEYLKIDNKIIEDRVRTQNSYIEQFECNYFTSKGENYVQKSLNKIKPQSLGKIK